MAQTSLFSSDTLIKNINSSKPDAEAINAQIKKLQQENDLIIAFATLNYAWARKGTYYVLASKNNTWQLYSYESRLPPVTEAATELTPLSVSADSAENIKHLYAGSELWMTDGDEDGRFCEGTKDCNINDAETWAISVATPKNIHTTTYYAPQFFEECCPGNKRRKEFVAIAQLMMKLAKGKSSAAER